MKTSQTTPPVPLPDWLNDCSFQSRQETPGLMPGIVGHHVKKSAAPISFHRDFAAGTGATVLAEHGLVTMTNPQVGMVVESPRANTPAKPEHAEILSELRTLRQLSASVFDPHSEHDFLPDLILFGVIGVLCVAWPIISMFGAMAGHH
jgi:hypothetical protein